MRLQKISITHTLNIAINIFILTLTLSLTVVFLIENTLAGYIFGGLFLGLSCLSGHFFYHIFWIHNWGRPLSEEKKRKREQYRRQMRDYQGYNLYHRLYRFADSTEIEYQAQKAREEIEKIHK